MLGSEFSAKRTLLDNACRPFERGMLRCQPEWWSKIDIFTDFLPRKIGNNLQKKTPGSLPRALQVQSRECSLENIGGAYTEGTITPVECIGRTREHENSIFNIQFQSFSELELSPTDRLFLPQILPQLPVSSFMSCLGHCFSDNRRIRGSLFL